MAKKLFPLLVLLLLFSISHTIIAQDMAYQEAPVLADMVAAGDLPAVEDRLPPSPLVLEPVEAIGQYGGTWRKLDNGNALGLTRQTVYVEPFLKWNRDANGMRANLAESWEWNDDATELTVNFRQGIRWSDGEPLTVDDYLFWWNDMVLNADVPVEPPNGTIIGGEVMTVEKVDDYTLHYTFPVPNPLFLELHSRGSYHSSWFVVPEHYMSQFHPGYSDSVEGTTELMARYSTDTRLQYADMPTFTAWKVREFVSDQLVVLDRNPYYWKVDTEGNQLPYIDTIQVEIAAGNFTEQVVLKAIAGEIDMQIREIPLRDIPVVLENAEAGDYQVKMWNAGDFAWPWLILMFDNVDEGLVDLMYEQDFRIALSHAINRPRINEISSLGLAQPRQFALSPEGPEFQSDRGQEVYEAWANSYMAFDPETAAALLDGIGVVDADGDGFRDRPDGSPLDLIVDIPNEQKSIDVMDLIKEDWESIGLKTTLNVTEWSIINERQAASEVTILAWPGAAAWGLISAAAGWTPVENVTYNIAGQHIGEYYQTGGESGVAPRPGSVLEKLQEAYTELITITDEQERYEKLLDAYQLHIDEGPVSIGTIGQHPSAIVVKNNFHNVPETGLVSSWDLGYPGSGDPEQFFFSG